MQNEAGIFLLKHAYYLRIVLDYYTTALNSKSGLLINSTLKLF